jgi:hypothetical protein
MDMSVSFKAAVPFRSNNKTISYFNNFIEVMFICVVLPASNSTTTRSSVLFTAISELNFAVRIKLSVLNLTFSSFSGTSGLTGSCGLTGS